MERAKNLVGKRFGRLTVLERAEDKRYDKGYMVVRWKCRCDCGNVVIKTSQGLLCGKSKSCGCLRKDIGNKPFAYNIGEAIETKYSEFSVLEQLRTKRESSNILDKNTYAVVIFVGKSKKFWNTH